MLPGRGVVPLLPGERGGAGLHVGDGLVEHLGDGHRVGGVGAVGVEDDPAVGQLHQLRVSGQHPDEAGAHQRQHRPDQAPQQGRFPAPVAPASRRWVPCSRTSQGRPSSRRPTGRRAQVGPVGDGQGGDDGGQGVTADELQHHRAGPGGADPAQQGAEPVGQVVGPVGEVGRALPGHQPDVHPVDVPGGGDLDQHGQDDPAPVAGGQVGDAGHRGPLAAVAPGPPLAPRRRGHPPGEARPASSAARSPGPARPSPPARSTPIQPMLTHKAAPAAPRPALPAPGSALGGPPGAPAPSEPIAALTNSHQQQAGATVFLALDCPARGHHVQGGPAGRRTRSATPTLDPAATHLVLAPTRKAGTEQLIRGHSADDLLSC